MTLKQKFSKATSGAELKQLGMAAAGAGVYTLLPTVLKQNTWGGFAIAVGGTWLAGVLLESPGMRAASIGIAAAHLMYTHANATVQDTLGTPIWTFGTQTVPALNGLQSQYVQNPYSGETIRALPPTDLPAPAALNDYVQEDAGMADELFAGPGGGMYA